MNSHVRHKNDSLVEEAELIEANPRYPNERLNDGREINVYLRDLARNPVADARNDTNLSVHLDDTENIILPQNNNEAGSFSQPDINSDDQTTPNSTDGISSDAFFKTLNLVALHVFADLSKKYGNNIYSCRRRLWQVLNRHRLRFLLFFCCLFFYFLLIIRDVISFVLHASFSFQLANGRQSAWCVLYFVSLFLFCVLFTDYFKFSFLKGDIS